MTETEIDTKITLIEKLYDDGACLDAIVEAIGTDAASLALISSRLGCSTRPGTKLDWSARRVRGEIA